MLGCIRVCFYELMTLVLVSCCTFIDGICCFLSMRIEELFQLGRSLLDSLISQKTYSGTRKTIIPIHPKKSRVVLILALN